MRGAKACGARMAVVKFGSYCEHNNGLPTWFSGDGAAARTFRLPLLRGGAVLFCGRVPHAGAEVTRGSRFIVAGFVRVRLRSGKMLPSCEARAVYK